MDTLSFIIWAVGIGVTLGYLFILGNHIKGLRSSPRELWLLYLTKILEYTAYGAANMTAVLFLSADCGLSDIAAGTYIGFWSMGMTIVTMLIGSVVDAVGVKKTLLFGTFLLLVARIFMPFVTNIYLVTILGFLPLAGGVGILGPVFSVGIKKYTTKEGAALGFGLFYALMNIGWALAAMTFDFIRGHFGEHTFNKIAGVTFSTYQIIFLSSFFLTIVLLLIILTLREGIELGPEGKITLQPPQKIQGTGFLNIFFTTGKNAARDTIRIFRSVISEKYFWVFMGLLGILVFVKIVFFHFQYTFPKYGIRVLGEGVKVGSIYGVLNPLLIVLLVPFVAILFKKVSSYKMMIIGSFISASSIFIAIIPTEFFAPLDKTMLGELIYSRWLHLTPEQQNPLVFALVLFVFIYAIGEAIWSPRLMQFTAEIAPKGREGTYISLSYLPFFASKLVAGPMSGWLLTKYVPVGQGPYPDHAMVWFWIGSMAMISPVSLLVFRKYFNRVETSSKSDH